MEQAHVDTVYDRLAEATESARSAADQGRSLYHSDRESYVREEDGTALFERDAFAYQAARRLAVLDAEHEGLVFGRLDLDDDADREVRYIGRIGVRDDDYEPLVIDWRARAAEPFYRATPNNPMDVVRRRVLRCRSDKVIGIEDDLLNAEANHDDLPIIGEGALMAALSRARGPRMRDIVATIQAEQDDAIRADYRGVTVISGGPGTGKTVVALHRAAYLLYSNRRRFENGGILVVGPGPVFMNYIERVLPSLGEDSVTLRAIGSVVSDVLPGVHAHRADSAQASFVKGSLRMVDVLKRLVNLPLVSPGDEGLLLRLTVKGEPLTLREPELNRIRASVLAHNKVNHGRESAQKAVVAALMAQVPDEIDLEPEAIEDLITDTAQFKMFMNAWWPPLSAPDVLARLADPDVVARVADGVLDDSEQRALSESLRGHDDWSVGDTALLDELAAILGTPPAEEEEDPTLFLTSGADVAELVTTADRLQAPSEPADLTDDLHDTYAHMLIDEAQDITPMQWRMLRRRGSQASWTIVGDLAQSSWPDLDEVGRAVRDLIGNAPHREFRLSVNYRSPAEVFNLAADVVRAAYPNADLPEAVRSTGVEPDLLVAAPEELDDEVERIVTELAGDVAGTIGVIVPPSLLDAVRDAATGRLAEALGEDAQRVTFISPLEAKGLEYDAVVVIAPDAVVEESPGGVRVLYVALTRPTQRLVTIDVGASPGAWRGSPTSRSTD
ncbi:HelD family protein [Nigerium massiliense]|uniref:HelD family protein n=1 Tax=Nigerium massiliense TaxID=1522317 RepID=UPI000693A781